ncbi:protein YLS7-like [Typha angustifolia]|uniref:protein YLS7-like n=1 Tax=Typha angustifolia TaxID=59011 RepID=UPI003C2C79F1
MSSPKSLSGIIGVRRSVSSIVISVGGIALSLLLISLFLVSSPLHSSFRDYILGTDNLGKPPLLYHNENTSGIIIPQNELSEIGRRDMVIKQPSPSYETPGALADPGALSSEREMEKESGNSSGHMRDDEVGKSLSYGLVDSPGKIDSGISDDNSASSSNTTLATTSPRSSALSGGSEKVNQGSCDLYQGKWVYDPSGPLYTNDTCPIITQMQNCQGNGRPDKEYENYRWKPEECNLPRFDGRKFLELMRGKTLAFVGDSVARNQMESLICILWQVEAPKNRGNRRMQKWYFRSTSTSIVRIWSSWLVHKTSDPFGFAPQGIDKIHLDLPDETFMEFLPTFDVVILSSGHWFAKKSAYILNNTIVGGQLWWPKEAGQVQINNIEAFGISVETCLTAIATHPNFTGLAVVRSYSPDHYEGGAWNTGGSCTGKVGPATEVVRNGFTNTMHEKQFTGFQRAVENVNAKSRSKLRFMDITHPFGYRPDGHPGPYRNPDPNKVTKRGPNGEPPPQDCLHWCMPGPIDTWNELLLEIIHREFEGVRS